MPQISMEGIKVEKNWFGCTRVWVKYDASMVDYESKKNSTGKTGQYFSVLCLAGREAFVRTLPTLNGSTLHMLVQ